MKKYSKEIVICLLQIFVFYLLPKLMGNIGALGMVLLLLIITFWLSILIGWISSNKIKYFFPLVVAVLFIPTIFIYYNESALIHSIWYLVDAAIGIVIGTIINKLTKKK